MSYCRFSSDNWSSDVYCYADVRGGFTTHVASSRYVGNIPKVPEFRNKDTIGERFAAHRAQMEFIKTAQLVPIGGPFDGETYSDATLEDLKARLLNLREAGYIVPQSAIDLIDEEMSE